MTTRRATTEAAESAAFWAWRDALLPMYPVLRWVMHAENEGKRAPWKARQIGLARGFPDVVCFVRRGECPGWARELKVYPNMTTPEQVEWLRHLEAEGWNAGVSVMRLPGDWIIVAWSLVEYLGLPAAVLPDSAALRETAA